MADQTSILFICMGNICRSPLAEGVFLHKANQRGVADRVHVDSAGTGGWHAGERPDPRMLQTAAKYGITLASRARQVRREDFTRFDLLVCMDEENRDNIFAMGAPHGRVKLLLEYQRESDLHEVPDPYYGGEDGFELVYRLVDRACDGLLEVVLGASKR